MKTTPPKITLILGSAPDALDAAPWARNAFENIVVINNAWRVREDWNYLIYPEDFPSQRMPPNIDERAQRLVTAHDYVPVQNTFGGFVYAGGTMAFTAGYWALGALKPDVMAFFGCDMSYDTAQGNTHFYGNGTADPLRTDVTLQSLEAKSARLMALAARQGCRVVNLSARTQSRLVFPRVSLPELTAMNHDDLQTWSSAQGGANTRLAIENCLRMEADLGYYVPSGEYWKEEARFDAKALRDIDAMWLASVG